MITINELQIIHYYLHKGSENNPKNYYFEEF